jgi:hypothetical protein
MIHYVVYSMRFFMIREVFVKFCINRYGLPMGRASASSLTTSLSIADGGILIAPGHVPW